MRYREQDLIDNPNFIKYFGVWLDKRKVRLYLNRDNYCVVDRRNYEKMPLHDLYLEKWDYFKQQKETLKYEGSYKVIPPPGLRFDKVGNELLLAEKYCKIYHKLCLKNYDLNMKFFEKLDVNEYNILVDKILRRYKKMIEIKDLNECKGEKGIYIMLQEKYKQMYIGQTTRDLKDRVVRHWKVKPKFNKIVCNPSGYDVIGVDSFGALDTTKIYVYYENTTSKIDKLEEKLVEIIPNKFITNRIGGGIHLNTAEGMLKALSTTNTRTFENL